MVHNRTLLLPYGVADTFTTFAHVAIDDLLAAMKPRPGISEMVEPRGIEPLTSAMPLQRSPS